jgi:hypothetical protein
MGNERLHTKGFWEVVPSGNIKTSPCTIRTTAPFGNLYVAEINCPHGCNGRHEKDARLISQAPDLLSALEATTKFISRSLFKFADIETQGDAAMLVKTNAWVISRSVGDADGK